MNIKTEYLLLHCNNKVINTGISRYEARGKLFYSIDNEARLGILIKMKFNKIGLGMCSFSCEFTHDISTFRIDQHLSQIFQDLLVEF